jgi:hypothetical protein
MLKKVILCLTLALSFHSVTPERAWAVADFTVPAPGGFLNVEYYVGTGAKTAYFVVDFGGTGGGDYAFGYRFDGEKYAADGLLALIGSGPVGGPFKYKYTSYPSGNTYTAPVSPYDNIFTDGFGYKTNYDEPADPSVNSWFFWRQLSPPNVSNWAQDLFYGPSGVEYPNGPHNLAEALKDHELLGFYDDFYDRSFNAITVPSDSFPTAGLPRIPTAVPEPSSVILLLLAMSSARYFGKRQCA